MTALFVSHNSARDLARALTSLAESRPPVSTRVLVVENGRSVAATRAVCSRFGATLVTPGRNLGYGAAANRAASDCRSEYLAIANPDLVFAPDSLARLIEFMDRCPDAGVVAPQLYYPDGTPQPSARRRPGFRYILAGRRLPLLRLNRAARAFQYLGSEKLPGPLPVEAVVGAFMLFRRRAFEEVGGFDRKYFMFAEDVDICLRLAPRWGVYLLPSARVVHAVGGSRRRARSFTEFHRLRSLRRFFLDGHPRALAPLINVLFAGYLGLLMAVAVVELGEREYSWRTGRCRR